MLRRSRDMDMATTPECLHGKGSSVAMAKTEKKKEAAAATDDGAGGKETAAAAEVLAIISRLVGRPFLDETASRRLEKLGKMMATQAVLQTLDDADHQLLGSLGTDLREAEATLNDVEDRHLRLQGLIVAHKGERRSLVRKLLLELKCSRMKAKLERRLSKAEGIVGRAHRQVKSIVDVDRRRRSLVPASSASSRRQNSFLS